MNSLFLPTITDLVNQVLADKRQNLITELNQLDHVAERLQSMSWKPPQRFLSDPAPRFRGIKSVTGVYAIYHVGDQIQLFYVGQGNIADRKDRHKLIFRNQGQPIVHMTPAGVTSTSDSVVGRKMYNLDANPNNWYFTYCACEKSWAVPIEHHIIACYTPPGNHYKMQTYHE